MRVNKSEKRLILATIEGFGEPSGFATVLILSYVTQKQKTMIPSLPAKRTTGSAEWNAALPMIALMLSFCCSSVMMANVLKGQGDKTPLANRQQSGPFDQTI